MPARLYYRRGGPKRFRYEMASGEVIRDAEIIQRIRSLAVPPAWQDVEIAASPRAKVQATGYDAAGRKQYIYHAKFRAQQERAKFDRLLSFANALPMMRRITGHHLRLPGYPREKVLAAMVRLIDSAYFRVGSERYARDNQTYGLATLRRKHLTVEGDTLIFDYRGKSGQAQHREVVDARLARIVAELDELPGYEIFQYEDDDGNLVKVRSDDVNAYIKDIMGSDFSAKDFRTWAGTLIAAVALSEAGKADTKTAQKRSITTAIRHVAGHLGNTPAIAKASYIDPRIIDHYLNGTTIKYYMSRINQYLKSDDSQHFSSEEVAVMKLLQRKLKQTGSR